MRNVYFILFLIVLAFSIGFFLDNKITGRFVFNGESGLDTCLYQTRTGANILPNKELCCDTMKRFFKCEPIDETEIFYGSYSAMVNYQCYNSVDGELKLFLWKDLEIFCRNEGYIQ